VVAQFATPTNVAPECVLMENEISMKHSASHIATQWSPIFWCSLFFYLDLPFWSEVVICPMLGGQHWILSHCTYNLQPVSSLLATLMVETGVAVGREPTGFDKTESVRSKWANKTIECFHTWEQLRVTWDILGWRSVRKKSHSRLILWITTETNSHESFLPQNKPTIR